VPVAGPSINLASQTPGSANLTVLGSGQGCLRCWLSPEFPALLAELGVDRLILEARAVPLANVEAARTAPGTSGERMVPTPAS